jgi:hypothetical protein
MLRNAPSGAQRWKRGGENTLVLWAATMLALVILWLALAWLARKILGVEFGPQSAATVWVIGIGGPLCLTYAVLSSIRWVKQGRDSRPFLRTDIEAGRVVEEHYVFTAAKRFQEPEHGGLFYFLRTAEGKVLTLVDPESQDLGASNEDPMKSSFAPRSKLVIVRAPASGVVISKDFSGTLLDAGAPVELSLHPRHWPESESYCSIPWDELESRLGPRAP